MSPLRHLDEQAAAEFEAFLSTTNRGIVALPSAAALPSEMSAEFKQFVQEIEQIEGPRLPRDFLPIDSTTGARPQSLEGPAHGWGYSFVYDPLFDQPAMPVFTPTSSQLLALEADVRNGSNTTKVQATPSQQNRTASSVTGYYNYPSAPPPYSPLVHQPRNVSARYKRTGSLFRPLAPAPNTWIPFPAVSGRIEAPAAIQPVSQASQETSTRTLGLEDPHDTMAVPSPAGEPVRAKRRLESGPTSEEDKSPTKKRCKSVVPNAAASPPPSANSNPLSASISEQLVLDEEQDFTPETSEAGEKKRARPGSFANDLSPAVSARANLPACQIGAVELLTFFPNHTQWPEVGIRFVRNGWKDRDISSTQLHAQNKLTPANRQQREAALRKQIPVNAKEFWGVDGFTKKADKVAANPLLTPVHTYDASGYQPREAIKGATYDCKLVEIARPVINWPVGDDRGIVTQVIAHAVTAQMTDVTTADIPRIAAQMGFRMPLSASATHWDQISCLNRRSFMKGIA